MSHRPPQSTKYDAYSFSPSCSNVDDVDMPDAQDLAVPQQPPPVPPRPSLDEVGRSIATRRANSLQTPTQELNIRVPPGSTVSFAVATVTRPAPRSASPEKTAPWRTVPPTRTSSTPSGNITRHHGDDSTLSESPTPSGQICNDIGCSERVQRLQREKEDADRIQTQLNAARAAAQEELAKEQLLRSKAEAELREQNIELEDIRKRWKQSAKELGKLRQSQEQGLYQVTDSYLVELAMQLRYNIRSFAIQHFSGELPKPHRVDVTDYYKYVQQTADNYKTYLASPEYCHYLIQAFLWRVFCYKVFGEFFWMPGRAASLAARLTRILEPSLAGETPARDPRLKPDTGRERRFQMWRANTSALLVEKMSATPETSASVESIASPVDTVVDEIRRVLDQFRRSRGDGYGQQLRKILDDAIALDLEISRQVARLSWYFGAAGNHDGRLTFDPSSMELGIDERPSGGNQVVKMVLAPALAKLGKSTGEGFDKPEENLARMEVTLLPIPDTSSKRR